MSATSSTEEVQRFAPCTLGKSMNPDPNGEYVLYSYVKGRYAAGYAEGQARSKDQIDGLKEDHRDALQRQRESADKAQQHLKDQNNELQRKLDTCNQQGRDAASQHNRALQDTERKCKDATAAVNATPASNSVAVDLAELARLRRELDQKNAHCASLEAQLAAMRDYGKENSGFMNRMLDIIAQRER